MSLRMDASRRVSLTIHAASGPTDSDIVTLATTRNRVLAAFATQQRARDCYYLPIEMCGGLLCGASMSRVVDIVWPFSKEVED